MLDNNTKAKIEQAIFAPTTQVDPAISRLIEEGHQLVAALTRSEQVDAAEKFILMATMFSITGAGVLANWSTYNQALGAAYPNNSDAAAISTFFATATLIPAALVTYLISVRTRHWKLNVERKSPGLETSDYLTDAISGLLAHSTSLTEPQRQELQKLLINLRPEE